ncbi:hypothetical protein Hanom_Chr03g00181791 [Helianthus anomalus]
MVVYCALLIFFLFSSFIIFFAFNPCTFHLLQICHKTFSIANPYTFPLSTLIPYTFHLLQILCFTF